MKIRLIKKMVKSGKIDGYKNRVSVSSRSYILSYENIIDARINIEKAKFPSPLGVIFSLIK